ncbi:MAG: M20 aminoacylase family protein [Paracoccaceae bacterium]
MPARNRFAELHDEITKWRRDFHAHPELRFQEHRTAEKVAELLSNFGCDEVTTGVGQTGVVGVIQGRAKGSGKVIGFRADMDALPIPETNDVPHASTHPGVMHACGHDGHTAMLLGAAKYLAETRNFDGTVVLIFQPAEEGSGGARAMLDDGLLTRWGIQEVYGMHNWPKIPAGQFAVRDGPQMAATAFFDLIIKGQGGHAALPHKAVDTTVAAAHVITAIQTIAARNIDPLKTVVVSTCGLRSDSNTYNVIPDKIELRGTVRYFDRDVNTLVEKRLREIAEFTARAFGAEVQLDYNLRVPPTVNTPEAAARAAKAAEKVCGDVLRDFDPVMPGEDFSEMLVQRPGAYLFIGNGDSADLHNPGYDFNDQIIPMGCSWYAEMAEQTMPLS